jgi:L-iditol 2-dehydrogenase
MRAIVYLRPEEIELRRVPIPEPGPGELLVRVCAATTCGTDLKTYRRGHPKFPPPFVFGHEFGGDVVALGDGAAGFQVGDRVTANVFAACGECFFCQRGQGFLCENLVYNFGAFAEYNLIPASIVRGATYRIPPEIPYAHAALVEPLATVVQAQELAAIQPGETVAIIGASGAIGMMHLQMARRAGAAQVIAIGHGRKRLAAAEELGASAALDAREGDVLAAVRDLTGGYGADVVIECAGRKNTWEAAVDMARRGGRVVWFGGLPAGTQVAVDAARVHYGSICLLNTHGATNANAREAFRLITSGEVRVAPLISETLPLEDLEKGLQKMAAREVIKVAIDPQGGAL